MRQYTSRQRRIPGLDFARLAATICIVLYHFSCESGSAWFQRLFISYRNGVWGQSFVCLFFVMSGALLFHRYGDACDPPSFYRKRFLSIYPEFWLAFGCCYTAKAVRAGTPFYNGHPARLLLSLLGLDGYFLYRGANYYILGEWFLGAIVLIYLLYPLLRRAFRRAPALLTCALLAACLAVDATGFFRIATHRNLLVCLFEFELGMLLMRYRERLDGAWLPCACLLLEVALLCVPLPLRTELCAIPSGLALYVLLSRLGARLDGRRAGFDRAVHRGAGLSYSIYLTHHLALKLVLRLWNPGEPLAAALALLLSLAVTLLAACALRFATTRILRAAAQVFCKTRKKS